MEMPHHEARLRYRPKQIRTLIVAEAPPDTVSRFFYFEDVPKQDGLFLEIMGTLYPSEKTDYLASGRSPELKRNLLRRFEGDGYYLEDLHEVPITLSKDSDDAAAAKLADRLSLLISRSIPVILIKATVFDAAAPRLRRAGFNVAPFRIPFPGSGQQVKFRDGFRSALVHLGRISE